MKTLLAILSVIALLCLAAYAKDKTPEEVAAEAAQLAADQAVWVALDVEINTLRNKGDSAGAIAKIDAAIAKPPIASWTDGHVWSLNYLKALAKANINGNQAAIDFALDQAKNKTWTSVPHPVEQTYAWLWILLGYEKQFDKAQVGLDSWIAVNQDHKILAYAYSCKAQVYMDAGDKVNAIKWYTKALLEIPGGYGNAEACIMLWNRIEAMAPTTLAADDYLALAKKVLMAYPPPDETVDAWAVFISRVSFRKESLQ